MEENNDIKNFVSDAQEKIKEVDPKAVAKKAHTKLRKYRRELIIFGSGMLVSRLIYTRKWDKHEQNLINDFNALIIDAFEKHEGNFRTENGTWVYPVYGIRK